MIEAANGKLDGFKLTGFSAFAIGLGKFLTVGASTFEAYTILLTGLAYYTMPEQYAVVSFFGPGAALALSSIVNRWSVPVDAISTIQLMLALTGLGYGAISLESLTEILAPYMSEKAIEIVAPAILGALGGATAWTTQTFGEALNYRHNITREEDAPRTTITSNISSFFGGVKDTATNLVNTVATTSYNPFTRGA